MKGEQLEALRKERNMTRAELAEWLGGCSAPAIVKYERNERPIPQWIAEKMLSSVTVELPLSELAELHQLTLNRGIDFSSLLAKALRREISEARQSPLSAKIVTLPSELSKVAEEMPRYGDEKIG